MPTWSEKQNSRFIPSILICHPPRPLGKKKKKKNFRGKKKGADMGAVRVSVISVRKEDQHLNALVDSGQNVNLLIIPHGSL